METQLTISFLFASLLLSIIPGPDNIFVLTESITKGKRNGVAISLGMAFGCLVHTIAAATGLSIIVQKSVMAFSIIKIIGAMYLFYLAFISIKEKRIDMNILQKQRTKKENIWYLIKKGFLMNALNPKVALFFMALLPQFISKTGFNITIQMLVLGTIFGIQVFLVFSIISFLSSGLTKYVNSERFWNVTKWTKGSILSFLGLALLLSTRNK
ncbi:LysE family translocator [Elizabethkingia anophelis]|uniref:LysE family translocator n=1 Tax=Elizabethkingia anophelis TaxID=1117645 RepID=UPI0013659973|nr:LysE family translocator [Elizabethkingia anophelis]MVW83007.1 LysE family translocator [Elizabethkingia anophelis]UTF99023.1 LysE family translocator [Elizabethkingia anophelis]UTG63781.1 LysE family translocator [Elizabethkingia anophelis]